MKWFLLITATIVMMLVGVLISAPHRTTYERIDSVCSSEPNPDECKARQAIRVYEQNLIEHQKDLDQRIGN